MVKIRKSLFVIVIAIVIICCYEYFTYCKSPTTLVFKDYSTNEFVNKLLQIDDKFECTNNKIITYDKVECTKDKSKFEYYSFQNSREMENYKKNFLVNFSNKEIKKVIDNEDISVYSIYMDDKNFKVFNYKTKFGIFLYDAKEKKNTSNLIEKMGYNFNHKQCKFVKSTFY